MTACRTGIPPFTTTTRSGTIDTSAKGFAVGEKGW
jgi:hypothetical protein